MKISLVVPNFLSGTSFLQQPLDFLYSASILEREGHCVRILDCRTNRYSNDKINRLLGDSELIVVTTTPCDQVQNYYVDFRYGYSVKFCNWIKQRFSHATIAICGAHGTVRPDLVKKEVDADIIILGEVMYTLKKLAFNMRAGLDIIDVPNLEVRKEGKWVKTSIDLNLWHPVIDDDIYPAFDKIHMDSYFGVEYIDNIPLRRQNRAVLQAGRGCPYSCSFCHNFYGKNIKRRDAKLVATEMEICQSQYGVKEIFFLDELFTLDRKWLEELRKEIQSRKIHLSVTIQTRIDCLDDDVLNLLYVLGVRDIWLGVESGDDTVLHISNKGQTNEMLMPTVEKIRQHKIRPFAFFMLGMPGETIASINKTLRTIYECKVSYTRSIMVCTPRYGTSYYETAVKEYPYIETHWYNLNAVKGLVANEMTPMILQRAKDILRDRDFLYKKECPQL